MKRMSIALLVSAGLCAGCSDDAAPEGSTATPMVPGESVAIDACQRLVKMNGSVNTGWTFARERDEALVTGTYVPRGSSTISQDYQCQVSYIPGSDTILNLDITDWG